MHCQHVDQRIPGLTMWTSFCPLIIKSNIIDKNKQTEIMVYLNKKIVLYVLFLLLAVIHFVTTSVVRDNIFTAIENLPRPVKQTKNTSLETKKSSKRKRKKFRTSGRLLGRPNPIKCSRRPKQLVDNNSGHYYFLSEDSNFKVNMILYPFRFSKL